MRVCTWCPPRSRATEDLVVIGGRDSGSGPTARLIFACPSCLRARRERPDRTGGAPRPGHSTPR
ncbi:hypothetical protein GCM10027160_28760 [Streptomyces calidiresistens]|uniref:Uncharacterized protein n=1 Tax=Streptomyces calidiresistens TaxID=1485586 RepID=A0A7W3T1N5_9ACTN|nr:hypothetical protein [Streptomyces calidiresistens]MBB0229304.1 hypothetical protein [Streptomyces calidiresistens]